MVKKKKNTILNNAFDDRCHKSTSQVEMAAFGRMIANITTAFANETLQLVFLDWLITPEG